jgi:RsmE family RNA methyltransferase
MNLLLLEPSELDGDQARVSGRKLRHLRRVLGKKVGDTVAAGRLDGPIGRAEIVALDEDGATLRCDLSEPPPAPAATRLVLALPRPPMLRRILAHATAMGIKRIALCGAARVEKSFWDSHSLRPEAIGEQLRLGLEQAGDTVLPSVTLHRRFRPFVEDDMDAIAGQGHRLVAHPAAAPSPDPEPGPRTVAIGPEGGWVEFELQRLADAGFSPWSLGPRPLRVETAVVAALGRLR